jgi:hypothetical protein
LKTARDDRPAVVPRLRLKMLTNGWAHAFRLLLAPAAAACALGCSPASVSVAPTPITVAPTIVPVPPATSPSASPTITAVPLAAQTGVMRVSCGGKLVRGIWQLARSNSDVARADFSNSSTQGSPQNWILQVRVYPHNPGVLLPQAVGDSPYPAALWVSAQRSLVVPPRGDVGVPIVWPFIDSHGRAVGAATYFLVISGTVVPPGYPAEVTTCTVGVGVEKP